MRTPGARCDDGAGDSGAVAKGTLLADILGGLNREQFHARLAALDEAGLRKALWTLYWRGSAPVREQVLAVVDPPSTAVEATGS